MAGAVTFFLPCSWSLYPSWLAVMGSGTRREVMARTAWMLLGFAVVVAAIGAMTGSMVGAVAIARPWLRRLAGAWLVGVGAWLLFKGVRGCPPALERVLSLRPVMAGAALGLGWVPCGGPVLGAIYALAASGGSAVQGAIMMLAFVVGMGLPLLAAARVWERVPWLWDVGQQVWLQRASGAVLALTGILLLRGYLAWPIM